MKAWKLMLKAMDVGDMELAQKIAKENHFYIESRSGLVYYLDGKPFITQKQVAENLGVSASVVRRYFNTGIATPYLHKVLKGRKLERSER